MNRRCVARGWNGCWSASVTLPAASGDGAGRPGEGRRRVVLDLRWSQVDLVTGCWCCLTGAWPVPVVVAQLFGWHARRPAPGRVDAHRAGRTPAGCSSTGTARRSASSRPMPRWPSTAVWLGLPVGAVGRSAAPGVGGLMAAQRARRGHVYRRRTKSGGWSAWYAVIDLDRDAGRAAPAASPVVPTRAEAYAVAGRHAGQPVQVDGPTLGEWLTGWVRRLGRSAGLDPASYTGHIDNYLVPLLGDLPLADLGAGGCGGVARRCWPPPGSPPNWRAGSTPPCPSALSDADARRADRGQPVPAGAAAARGRYQPAVWSARAGRALPGRHQPATSHAGLWRVALLLGMRRGELLGLRWRDLDLDAGTLTVRTTRVRSATRWSKGRRRAPAAGGCCRWMPRTRGDAETALGPADPPRPGRTGRARWSTCSPTRHGQPLHPAWVSRRFTELVERLGLPQIRFHDLRHTSATLGLAAGESLKEVSARLGHSSIVVTADTYLTPPDTPGASRDRAGWPGNWTSSTLPPRAGAA